MGLRFLESCASPLSFWACLLCLERRGRVFPLPAVQPTSCLAGEGGTQLCFQMGLF